MSLKSIDSTMAARKKKAVSTREYLLITCDEELCGTADGESFEGALEGSYATALTGKDLMV